MEKYIQGNKEASEEAFDNRDASWGANIIEIVRKGDYGFFTHETKAALQSYDLRGKTVGQMCCNNGRELLSLVGSSGAKEGIGFDIAENQISFANEKASELKLPCRFIAQNVYEIGASWQGRFDLMLLTIGALCWLKDLDTFFAIVGKCLKPGGKIVISEQHPFTNLINAEDEQGFDPSHPLDCVHSYFEHEWVGNEGMFYITKKTYTSKTFTDYTHPLCDILGGICRNGMYVTGFQEFDQDLSGGFEYLNGKHFPLSMLITGEKR